jgi:predicted phosphodiesterase
VASFFFLFASQAMPRLAASCSDPLTARVPDMPGVRRGPLLALVLLLAHPAALGQAESASADVLLMGLLADAQESGERPLLRAAVQDLLDEGAQTLLYAGDTSYAYAGPPEDWVDALGPFAAEGLLFVPGNHDDARKYGPFYPHGSAPPTWWTWERAGLVVIGIDTNRPLHEGSDQLTWLRASLDGREADTVIVAGHISWWAPDTHRDETIAFKGDADTMHALMLDHDVELVVAGHEHYYARSTHDGITYLVMGAVEAQIREVPEEMRTTADVWAKQNVRGVLHLSADALALRVSDTDGRVVDSLDLPRDIPPAPPRADFGERPGRAAELRPHEEGLQAPTQPDAAARAPDGTSARLLGPATPVPAAALGILVLSALLASRWRARPQGR